MQEIVGESPGEDALRRVYARIAKEARIEVLERRCPHGPGAHEGVARDEAVRTGGAHRRRATTSQLSPAAIVSAASRFPTPTATSSARRADAARADLAVTGGRLVGSDADLVIVDLDREVKVRLATLNSVVDFSLHDGWVAHGWADTTIAGGQVLYEQGPVVAERPRGRYLRLG